MKSENSEPSLQERHVAGRTSALWSRLADLIGAVLRRKTPLILAAGADVFQRDGKTVSESAAGDPQFEVSGVLPRGWVKIRVRVEAPDSVGRGRLYLDLGDGYSERSSYDLGPVNATGTLYLSLGPETRKLRFDPIDRPGQFTIKEFVVRRITRFEAAMCSTHPANTLSDAESDPLRKFVRAPKLDSYDAWLEVNEWNSRRKAT